MESIDAWVETTTCFGPARLFLSLPDSRIIVKTVYRCFSGSLESVDAWVETKTCFGPARLFPSMTTVGQYIFMTGGQNKNNK